MGSMDYSPYSRRLSVVQKFGFIDGVDNVNWSPYRDSKSVGLAKVKLPTVSPTWQPGSTNCATSAQYILYITCIY